MTKSTSTRNAAKRKAARAAGRKPQTETAQTRTSREVDIYVFDRKIKEWKLRTTITVESTGDDTRDANTALKGYGIAGSRPRLGEANSKSGKRFKAVPTIA